MLKLIIGVAIATLLLSGVFYGEWIIFENMGKVFFAVNNAYFLFAGFVVGCLFYREFCTVFPKGIKTRIDDVLESENRYESRRK